LAGGLTDLAGVVGDAGDEVAGAGALDPLRFERQGGIDDLGAQFGDDGHRDAGERPGADPCAGGHDDAGDRHGDGTRPYEFGTGTGGEFVDEAADRPRADEAGPGVGKSGDDEEDDPA
jgi:hypothetical protein